MKYDVFIYSIQYAKTVFITPFREFHTYNFEAMGKTLRMFLSDLKDSNEEFKQEDDLNLDKLNEESYKLKLIISDSEKKYVKLKDDSESFKRRYREIEAQINLINQNEISRLRYEFNKLVNEVDLFTPLKKLDLRYKPEYCFNFQKDEIILKVNLEWYFDGGKDEMAGYRYFGSKYYFLDLKRKEYVEVIDNRYEYIINWLKFDMIYNPLN